jgi:integrase/recombinase XerD
MIDSFVLSLRIDNKSARTIAAYTDAAAWFGGWLLHHRPGVTGWAAVSRDELQAFFLWLLDQRDPAGRGYAPGYVNHVARGLQQFFRWHAAEEDVADPFDKFKVPPPPKLGSGLVPVVEVEDLARLVHDAEAGRDYESRRDAAILRLYACTGCRLSELALLRVADVNVPNRTVTVTGKGAKVRQVRIDQKAARALDRFLRVRAQHRAAGLPALWIGVRRREGMTAKGVYRMIVRRSTRLGIRIHPHQLRHTFAHRWLDAGGAEGDLMELAGWESPQMLRHYGASARAARARRAYDRVNVMGDV